MTRHASRPISLILALSLVLLATTPTLATAETDTTTTEQIAALQYQTDLVQDVIESAAELADEERMQLLRLINEVEVQLAELIADLPPTERAIIGLQNALRFDETLVRATITGDAQRLKADAEAVIGTDLDADSNPQAFETRTYTYDYEPSAPDLSIVAKANELEQRAMTDLAADIGTSYFDVFQKTDVSIKKFNNRYEVKRNSSVSRPDPELVDAFGTQSIITDVDLYVGAGVGFFLHAWSDQDERMTVGVGLQRNVFDDNTFGFDDGEDDYTYGYSFYIHDQLVERESDDDATINGMVSYVATAFQGLGAEFGVSDAVIARELVDYLITNRSFYRTTSRNFNLADREIPTRADDCYGGGQDQEIVTRVLDFVDGELQYDGSLADIVTIYPRITVPSEDDDGGQDFSYCHRDSRNFFPNTKAAMQ